MRAWRKPPKEQWKPKKDKKGASSEKQPAIGSDPETSQGKVSMVCVNDQTALHSPVWINGVKSTRCLIDSGSVSN